MKPTLDHRRLRIYHRARDWYASIVPIIEGAPRGAGEFTDQLRRAAMSVMLNIAEGAGEWAPREKARFYRMARRSAVECSAILDFGVASGWFTEEAVERYQDELVEIVAVLVAMGKNRERDARPR